MEITLGSVLLLVVTGFFAGGINTVAGGGSNLTLPALMMLGIPADIANGTNRISITLQCLVGLRGYDKHEALDRPALVPILVPTIAGGVIGAVAAALLPNLYLKPVLLTTILMMSALILLRPNVIAPPEGTPALSPNDKPMAWWSLFGAGVYGGFVQAGVGFILIAALAGGLRYDLLRANALKTVCALAFTSVALMVFIIFDQVWWVPGLILAIGSMTGAHLAVKIAVKASQNSIKWFLFIMTLFAVIGGFLF
ncbi:MAG: sulfite exporter TauE/SafE family protein [Gammaproteobacteria bacterium]|nr:sulfite exporter TauE/SafE family protein [Gammaproteobacteria bacterium]MBT3858948.1 sulfite exporter TauE/SafE family protein [Gammaproteobacteria bacterium]MBT3988276.1 sulfite exporter TauE/SafE family protein [Gammaproteobacteria bacterium]MBT4257281.1 sulfite exporter TauE/SafE family protein [Gammaproteobacteria bacterium]MBT4582546.1 sulfite exporter TauE/SafE family protein [Gammaproteobacteria bacterium]